MPPASIAIERFAALCNTPPYDEKQKSTNYLTGNVTEQDRMGNDNFRTVHELSAGTARHALKKFAVGGGTAVAFFLEEVRKIVGIVIA